MTERLRSPDESPWPTAWATIPLQCPICGCPTIPDRHLRSRAGPGWRCSRGGCEHFWQVRMNPLRRYLATHPPEPSYPWYDTPETERRAWLKAHYQLPRLAPSPLTNSPPPAASMEPSPETCPLTWLKSDPPIHTTALKRVDNAQGGNGHGQR